MSLTVDAGDRQACRHGPAPPAPATPDHRPGRTGSRRPVAPAADRRRPAPTPRRASSASSSGCDAAGHHVHLGALRQRDLRGDVRAAAEAVQAQPAAGRKLGAQQRPVADDAGAQQRGKLAVAVTARQMVSESRRDCGEFGVSAVGVPAGVAGMRAQVLVAPTAVLHTPRRCARSQAMPTRSPTRNSPSASAPTSTTSPTTSWPGVTRSPMDREITLGDVQVGTAHTACPHGHQEFRAARPGNRPGDLLQRSGVIGPG